MFLGHIAVGLAGKQAAPAISLGTWILAVQLVDLVWPIFLLLGLEHVRIAPGITAFTPLDFYDYPFTHSLVAGAGWALVLAGIMLGRGVRPAAAWLLAAGVLSHGCSTSSPIGPTCRSCCTAPMSGSDCGTRSRAR